MTNINKYGTGFPLKINSEILVSESEEREKKNCRGLEFQVSRKENGPRTEEQLSVYGE